MPPKKKGKSSKYYYDRSPESKEKKKSYDTAYHSTPARKKYRSKLNAANRKAGTYGNGDGKDMSHTKSGRVVKEKASQNRARNRGRK
tara:strand:+ start:797 stop:1057 length:261 start_codon:yes stop_codon:yes gene_type:complete